MHCAGAGCCAGGRGRFISSFGMEQEMMIYGAEEDFEGGIGRDGSGESGEVEGKRGEKGHGG